MLAGEWTMVNGDGDNRNGVLASRLGSVTSIEGSKVHLALAGQNGRPNVRVTVGNFVRIQAGAADLIGIITTLASGAGGQPGAVASLDLLGEIVLKDGAKSFQRGVACYPAIGDAVDLLPPGDLRVVYQATGSRTATVGALYQDPETPACIKVEDLLTKHFAVLGTTGVGKSSGVAVILDQVLRTRQDVRIFLLDVHNEYASLLRRPRQHHQPAQSQAAVLALQPGRDRRRHLRRPPGDRRGNRDPGGGDPAREEQVRPVQGGE